MRLSRREGLATACRLLLTLLLLVLFGAGWTANFAYHDALADKSLDQAGFGERGYKLSPPWRCPYGRGEDFGGNREGREVQGYVCTSFVLPTQVHEIPSSADWRAGLGD